MRLGATQTRRIVNNNRAHSLAGGSPRARAPMGLMTATASQPHDQCDPILAQRKVIGTGKQGVGAWVGGCVRANR